MTVKSILSGIYNRLIVLLYYIFRFFPLNNTVVASSFKGCKYGDNPAYIIEAIHKCNLDLKLIWLKEKKNDIVVPEYVEPVLYNRGVKCMYYLATAKVVIDSHHFPLFIKKRNGQLFIETWHGGLGIKKLELEVPEFGNTEWMKRTVAHTCKTADVFISQSDFLSSVYKSAFHYNGPIFKCGFPKNDILVTESSDNFDNIRCRYVENDTKILLYAPTYRSSFYKDVSFDMYFVDFNALKAALESKGEKWTIMVRFHPTFAGKIKRKMQGFGDGVIDITDYPDTQKIIVAVDAVLSDYSSILFDAALRDIPCFIYATDFEEYKADRGTYFELRELPFPYATNKRELISNILSYDHATYLHRWHAFKEQTGLYEPGNASMTIAKKIIQHLNGEAIVWN